ncbi:MAG: ABC transporter permease [Peptostreptococcaceae bacterium]|nr:ABC transporter permease [Peptostreptococcaceae bacterium]
MIWIVAGTIIPIGAIAYYGLTDRNDRFTLENVLAIGNSVHLQALWLSVLLALISTVICFLIAYPLAIIMKNSNFGKRGFMIFLFILPMWMNFLLRTMAWQVLLEKNGVINGMLEAIGLPGQEIINTLSAIVLGMVYDFLPFMILPIYNVISKIDDSIIEAAYDLGASTSEVITQIYLPLSVPGIVSGVNMVFIPSLTTFVISNMLGGGKINLIGNIIEQEFTVSSNWNLGSGLSLVMMLFIVVSMIFLERFDKTGEDSFI